MSQVLVQAWQDRMGNVYACPVRQDLQDRFEAQTGDHRAFFQESMGAEEFLETIPLVHRRAVRDGWTVQFLWDLFELAQLYGYDAQEVVHG